MARVGTRVHTSTQGISRRSYQKGRSLGGNISSGKTSSLKVDYPRGYDGPGQFGRNTKHDADQVEGFNVSYGETFHPTDLADIKATLKDKPPKGLNLVAKPSKDYKKGR